MLSWVQGRVSRRYIVVAVAVILLFTLYQTSGLYHLPEAPVLVGNGQSTTSSPAVKPVDIKSSFKPSSFDWSKAKVYHPVENIKSPPKGRPKKFPNVQTASSKLKQDDLSKARADKIKEKVVKSWGAYKTHAWTLDELMPLSGKGKQSLSGWSVQIIDALDTLWIMDLKDDFYRGVQEVARIDWAVTSDNRINLFEVTIRYLGGLLAAYDLSGEEVLLTKATELGDALYATFDTPNRLPSHWLNYMAAKNGMQEADTSMSGAAGGSLCMEFTRLSQITGDPKYYDATERIKQFFVKFQDQTAIPGLWPKIMDYRKEAMSGSWYSLGAGADSQYEYLPKMHALLGGLDSEYEQMTVKALEAARDNLLFKPMTPGDQNILMAGDAIVRGGKVNLKPEMQHLTCFLGGTYALAGKLLSRDDFVDIGSRLTSGCVWAYDAFPTNLMPETAMLVPCRNNDGPCQYDETLMSGNRRAGLPEGFTSVNNAKYLLRPEAIESVFYMWRITGDQHWRDAAWRMWEGLVAECETELAFATIDDVTVHASNKVDKMETFWLGETAKYYYLMYTDDKVFNLDEWVLNTEAHSLKRPR